MVNRITFFLVLFCFVVAMPSYGQIKINEVVASNETLLFDEDGDASDWIELYNAGDTAVNLLDYSLSDSGEEWFFSAVDIEAGEFLVVFASNKDRAEAGQELHTNFKVSSGGETLFLRNDTGVLMQELELPPLNVDESYSAYPDGSDDFSENTDPSPWGENTFSINIAFSHDRGIYDAPFELALSVNSSDVELHYTTNGATPTHDDLLYDGGILIEDKTNADNYLSEIRTTPAFPGAEDHYYEWTPLTQQNKKGMVVKVAAFDGEEQISEVYTHTYLVLAPNEEYSLPIVSLSFAEEDFFSNDTGIYVPGDSFDETDIDWTGNYYQSGEDWERPIFMEYFVEGEAVVVQEMGARIHGGKTRSGAQKSLKFYPRAIYGKKNIKYPIFKHKDQEEYKRVVLRTAMASWYQLLVDDISIHQITKGLNFDIQEYQPTIVFFNGEYWGIQTWRERIDRYKFAQEYNLSKDSVTIYASYGNIIDGLEYDIYGFYDFRDGFMANFDPESESDYAYVKTKIDVDNLIDYYITQLFVANRDWPGNNSKMWRSPQYDNKWRWVFYDTDGGYGINQLDDAVLHRLFESEAEFNYSPLWSTLIIRKLIQNSAFQEQFVNRMKELLTTTFASENTLPIINAIKQEYRPEMERHTQRWPNWSSVAEWEEDFAEELILFMKKRPCDLQQQMIDVFGVEPFMDCSSKTPTDYTLYPNPSDGAFTIEIDGAEGDEYDCFIWNDLGQLILHKKIGNSTDLQFNGNVLAEGVYFVQVNIDNEIITKKLVIMY